jgi:two-component system LytT family sensor kinase
MQIKRIRLLAPVVFWLFQIIVFLIRNVYLFTHGSSGKVFEIMILTFPIDCLTFCVFYFFFAPKFFKREKPALYGMLAVLFFILNSGLWVGYYFLNGIENAEELQAYYISSMGHNLLYSFYGILFRIGIDWYEKQERQKDMERQQVRTELALLRSQINPHFLFNILNNINSFSKRDPDKTSYAIIKLADIMRYMLYEASAELVPIGREIAYIRSYLDLQKLRYKDPGFVQFDLTGNTSGIFIPPMLFIPFIENAFKHGCKSTNDKITLSLTTGDGMIYFACRNARRILSESEKKTAKGIGIQNIKRRLDLLYPDAHTLRVTETVSHYFIELTITCDENQMHRN